MECSPFPLRLSFRSSGQSRNRNLFVSPPTWRVMGLLPMSAQLTLFDYNRGSGEEPHNFGSLIFWKDAPLFVQRKVPNLPLQIDPRASSPRRNPLPSTSLSSQFSLCRHVVIFTTGVRFAASPLSNFVPVATTYSSLISNAVVQNGFFNVITG